MLQQAPPPPPIPRQVHSPQTAADAEKCILQFSTAMYFCMEGSDKEMDIDIVRMGCAENECSCWFSTKDATAFSGQHYEEHQEMLVFNKGEIIKTVCVKLVDDDAWNTTL